jgi:RNA polymerase sigma-70 factor (ECF subfamily)
MAISVEKVELRQLSDSFWDRSDLSFETLFREHWERVCEVIFRLVGDREESEDLAVETFLRLYRHPPMDGRKANLSGWLYRVATRLGYNALRARRRRHHYEEQAGQIHLSNGSASDVEAEVEARIAQYRVRTALQRLKPRDAQLLVLRHSGFSYAEIASALGVSSNSVGTFLSRAERKFERQYLALARER